MSYPAIGCSVDELDTPALCIDLDLMETNIERMAAICRQHGVGWRPHTKAVKTPEIARLEIAAGALGVTCAKLGEAEVMAEGGIRDILVANQIVGRQKMLRLTEVCLHADLIVAIDHQDQVRAMSEALRAAAAKVRLLVEIDIGLNRAGVSPGEPAVQLAQFAARQPGVELAGIMGYEGHLLTLEDAAEKARRIREVIATLVGCRDDFLRAGLPCPIVSAGGTGSYKYTLTCPGVTELQAGGLIFMDAFYRHKCQVHEFDHALKVLCTVVSRPALDRAIIDAGRKSVHGDLHPPLVAGHEHEIRVTRLSAEHGELALSESARGLKIGARLELIPGYSDMTNVLHNDFYALRRGRLEAIWPLLARGRLQ
jgi:D-serine deaminase-like pyridoxal phosphate-dependent protein